jgi:Lipase (class 3)
VTVIIPASKATLAQYVWLCSLAETQASVGVTSAPLAPLTDLPFGMEFVDYITGVDKFSSESDTVYFGFLLKDIGAYYLVIRGTEHAYEWADDAEFPLVLHPQGVGKVEEGFWSIYETLQYQGKPLAESIHEACSGERCVVMGHSLGGPLAVYTAYDLACLDTAASLECYAFACPKPGDGAFTSAFGLKVPDHQASNYIVDLVPHLPPLPEYSSVPNVFTITPQTGEAKISFSLECNHNAGSYCALLDWVTHEAVNPSNICVKGRNNA